MKDKFGGEILSDNPCEKCKSSKYIHESLCCNMDCFHNAKEDFKKAVLIWFKYQPKYQPKYQCRLINLVEIRGDDN